MFMFHPVRTDYVPGPVLAAEDLMINKTDQDVVLDLRVGQSEWIKKRVNR